MKYLESYQADQHTSNKKAESNYEPEDAPYYQGG